MTNTIIYKKTNEHKYKSKTSSPAKLFSLLLSRLGQRGLPCLKITVCQFKVLHDQPCFWFASVLLIIFLSIEILISFPHSPPRAMPPLPLVLFFRPPT